MTMSMRARQQRRQQTDQQPEQQAEHPTAAADLPPGWYRDKGGRIRNEHGKYATLPEGWK